MKNEEEKSQQIKKLLENAKRQYPNHSQQIIRLNQKIEHWLDGKEEDGELFVFEPSLKSQKESENPILTTIICIGTLFDLHDIEFPDVVRSMIMNLMGIVSHLLKDEPFITKMKMFVKMQIDFKLGETNTILVHGVSSYVVEGIEYNAGLFSITFPNGEPVQK